MRMDSAEGYDLRSSMTLVTNSEMVANEKERKNSAKCNIPAVSGTYFRLQQRVLTGML